MTFWHFFSVLKLSNLGFCSQNVEPDLLHSRPRTGQKRTGRVFEGIFGQLESYAVRQYKICPLAVKSWYFFSPPTLERKNSKLGGGFVVKMSNLTFFTPVRVQVKKRTGMVFEGIFGQLES